MTAESGGSEGQGEGLSDVPPAWILTRFFRCRYRCLRCANYSLCLSCFSQAATKAAASDTAKTAEEEETSRHHSGHPFERLLRPNDPHPMLVGAPWRPDRSASKAKSPPPVPNTLASAKLAARWRLGSSIVLNVAVSSGEASARCLLRPSGPHKCWESECGPGPHWIRLTLRRGMLLDRLELQLPGADAWPKFPRKLALWAGAHPERLALLQRVSVPREAAAFGWVRLLLRPRRR